MKTCLMLIAVGIGVLAGGGASADFTWNFTSDAEGWVPGDTAPGGWGMHGASLGWEANGEGDGKLVITYDGGYPASPSTADFNPVIFRFDWDAPTDWADSAEGAGGATGVYCLVRMKVNGVVPAVNEGEHFRKFEVSLDRFGLDSGNYWGYLPMGQWITTVWYVDAAAPAAERLTFHFGTLGRQSYKFFEAGGSVEIDSISFVSTTSFGWDFETDTSGWIADNAVSGYDGVAGSSLADGIWTIDYIDAAAPNCVPMITGEHVTFGPQTAGHVYMRCRVNCDPALSQIQLLGVWQPGWQMYDFGGLGTTVNTNEWVTLDVQVGAGTFSQWRIDLGANYTTLDAIPELLGGSVDVDYIVVTEAALTDDTDADGLTDVDELGGGTDPNDSDTDGDGLNDGDEVNTHFTDPRLADTDGDGMRDGWEILFGLDALDDGSIDPDNGADGDPDNDTYSNLAEYNAGTDPMDPESFPQGVPVAGGLALLAASAAIVAAFRKVKP